jgi:cyclophilin family peptidyl-prolyl cis-trans isomerase
MKRAPSLVLFACTLLATAPALAANVVARFTTVLGNFDVELCTEISDACPGVAPVTVANFLHYVDDDVYPPTMFIHRRGAGGQSPLVIQGGGYYLNDMNQVANVPQFAPIPLELGANLSNVRGTIAMARLGVADTGTATDQWFVNLVDNVNLDTVGGGYAVFGKVVSGLDTVDAIGALTIYNGGGAFAELPLLDTYPGSGPGYPYFVYVSNISRVPEPDAVAAACGAGIALAALAARRRA